MTDDKPTKWGMKILDDSPPAVCSHRFINSPVCLDCGASERASSTTSFNTGTADPETCSHDALMTCGSVTSCMYCKTTMKRCPACKCEKCGGMGYVPAKD